MPLRVIIIEDEAPAFRRLNNLLLEIVPDIQIIEVLDSIEDTVKWLNNHETPDLIFSDIQLADGLSFDIYEKAKPACPVVFTTAYDEYMLNAFKTNGIDYLLKPVKKEELQKSIEKYNGLKKQLSAGEYTQVEKLLQGLREEKTAYKSRFLVKTGERLTPIASDEVAYFNSHDGLAYLIRSDGKKFVIDHTLDELEKLLDPDLFCRLNRQYMAHIASIRQIHQYFKGKLKVELQPRPEEDVVISREKASAFKQWMDR